MILADDTGTILYANPASERLLGRRPADLLGTVGFDMVRGDHLPLARDAFGRCLEHPGQPVTLQVDIDHAAGGTRTLAVRLTNRIPEAEVGAVVVHFREAVEEQRRLEAQLRQAQKMEAVGQMTAGIAHDFNNVLSVIIGNAELLAGQPGKGVSPEDLADLRSAAERGSAMVKKLLGYSRQAELKVEPTDLGRLVEGLRGMLRHLISSQITIQTQGVAGCLAPVDPSAVEQIVINLVTNARDAMAGHGVLRIEVYPVEVGTEHAAAPWMSAGPYVRVSVTDTGIGMDEATRVRVFEPFFTTKPAGVGTGLGLSMVYGLVKQQRGYVEVQSAPGEGTTVSLYFPRLAAPGGSV
jgi:two-component system cell cycle sensor histidine kinase/response regulator CckA